jgi:hypothetical protein
VATPSNYGFPWDGLVAGFQGAVVAEHGSDLTANPNVRDLGTVKSSIVRIENDDVNVYAFATLKGSVSPTLLEGRLPRRPDEVVLGTATLRDAHAGIGDVVAMAGVDETVQRRVVGTAAFPILDDRSAVGRGAVLTSAALDASVASESINHDLLVTWSPGVDVGAANRDLEERTGAEVFAPRLPADVNNLKLVEGLPRALAVFLALVAGLALAHTLVTTVRRRGHDLAVLRALGFVGAQVSATVAWQATAFAVVGLIVGIPLGIAAGRAAWTLVATAIGVADRPAIPLVLLGVMAVSALLIANLLAALPGRMARAIRPATTLRTG